MASADTPTQLLDRAQSLVQSRGFNAFSYKDLAASVGIRTASIHYHFPTKGDLGLALMQRYRAGLDDLLASLDQRRTSAKARLLGLMDAYAETEAQGAICLCGSLASDQETLGEDLSQAVTDYLDSTLSWVEATLEAGAKSGEFDLAAKPAAKPADLAASLVASLQGALLLSRAADRGSIVGRVRRTFLHSLGAA